MAKVFIMSGLPFSGKSTLSKSLAKYLDIPRISFDETWLEIETERGSIPGSDAIEQWRYVCKVCEDKTKRLLESGTSVVYDNLGSSKKHRDEIKQLANEAGAESKIVYVDVSKEEVTKRRERNLDTKERHQVSDENFDTALKQFEPPTEGEIYLAYNPIEKVADWLDREFGNRSRSEKE